jgi:hypothetical protein
LVLYERPEDVFNGVQLCPSRILLAGIEAKL